jgi:steroid 5-alpha reductase family enzyme
MIQQSDPKNWWWKSIIVVYIVQQLDLIGLSLPMYFASISQDDWNVVDTIATICCLTGIIIAYFADNQLWNFMKDNEQREAEGKN